jgi:multiple sugar transport system substrate-binding protein
MSKKQIMNVVFSIILIAILAACAPQATTTSAPPAATTQAPAAAGPVTINILVEGGGHSLQDAIAKKFEEQTGNKVNFIEVPYQDVHDKFLAEMAAGGSSYDVATIDVIWIPEFAQFAESLDSMFTPEVKADLFPSLVNDAQFDGRFVGMPTWANAEILFYRKDLFEDPKEQADFKAKYGYDLKPPTNWQEFMDAAIFFTRDTNGDGTPDLYGTDVKGGVETEWLATVLQAGSPGVVLDNSGNIIIDNQAHIDALQYYIDLHCKNNVSPPNVNEIDWNASQQLFFSGKLAMERFWAHNYRFVTNDSVIYGKVGVAPMIAGPGGVGAIPGPWYNIVPTTSKNKEVAMQYVQFAYENNALGLDAPLGLAARISAYNSYANKPGFEHFKPLIDTLNAKQTIGRPLVKNWNEITNEVLIPLVQKALTCNTPVKDILTEAKTQIEQLSQ